MSATTLVLVWVEKLPGQSLLGIGAPGLTRRDRSGMSGEDEPVGWDSIVGRVGFASDRGVWKQLGRGGLFEVWEALRDGRRVRTGLDLRPPRRAGLPVYGAVHDESGVQRSLWRLLLLPRRALRRRLSNASMSGRDVVH